MSADPANIVRCLSRVFLRHVSVGVVIVVISYFILSSLVVVRQNRKPPLHIRIKVDVSIEALVGIQLASA